ncbi:hypothetical protein Droror1_Dr00010681 [Drosera rotundifolia]
MVLVQAQTPPREGGHRVTALDMAASGINMKSIEEVHTFKEYCETLTFMASLASTEKVILVGHSLGGMNLALAMENFPEKISVAVFLAVFLPDTIHQPSHVLEKVTRCEKFREMAPDGTWQDTRFSTYGSLENPGTSILLGDEFTSHLYSASSVKDLELAKMLKRPSSRLVHDLSREREVHGQGLRICEETMLDRERR